MAVILRKMLRIGKLPGDMRAEVESEGIIHLAEFVDVPVRFTGSVPGRRSQGLLRGYVGSLALTNQRVLGTLSTVPQKAGRIIDQPWASGGQPGMVAATLAETGLVLDIPDLSVVDPAFSGSLSVRYKEPLSAEILSRLPTRSLAFDVPPKFVYSLLGIPRG